VLRAGGAQGGVARRWGGARYEASHRDVWPEMLGALAELFELPEGARPDTRFERLEEVFHAP